MDGRRVTSSSARRGVSRTACCAAHAQGHTEKTRSQPKDRAESISNTFAKATGGRSRPGIVRAREAGLGQEQGLPTRAANVKGDASHRTSDHRHLWPSRQLGAARGRTKEDNFVLRNGTSLPARRFGASGVNPLSWTVRASVALRTQLPWPSRTEGRKLSARPRARLQALRDVDNPLTSPREPGTDGVANIQVNEVPRLEEHDLRKRFDRRKTVAPAATW